MNRCAFSFSAWILAVGLGCASAPVRSQSTTINLGALFDTGKNLVKSQTVGAMSTQEEMAIGKGIVASTLGVYPLVSNAEYQHYINQVGVWIALQSTRPELPWRFALVVSDNINAFAVPGGTVLVTQGMLQHVVNEAELACVLGHEIAHISRRHHIAVLQKSLLLEAGASALSVQSKSGPLPSAQSYAAQEAKEIFSRGLDRSAEREADADGVLLAARAGYDPAACFNFMQRLASLKTDAGPLEALYKTHPSASDRAVDVDATMRQLKGAAPGEGARPALPAMQQ